MFELVDFYKREFKKKKEKRKKENPSVIYTQQRLLKEMTQRYFRGNQTVKILLRMPVLPFTIYIR